MTMKTNYKIKILIADDHELYLEGLKGLFMDSDIYEVIGQASNGQEMVRKAVVLNPQIILTDLRMPVMNGARAIEDVLSMNREIKCLVLTNFDNDHSLMEAMEAGAAGYITKNMPKEDLLEALDYASRGVPYFCRSTSTKMVRLMAKSDYNPYLAEKKVFFNGTERKIVHLICEEKNNIEIALLLNISIRTVENNRSRIFRKMNVKTTAGVAIYAVKHAMYSVD